MTVKLRLKCKNASSTIYPNFIKGKYYDVYVEYWSDDTDKHRYMMKLNGRYRNYFAISECGDKQYISPAIAKAIFEFDADAIRNDKIEEILK